MLKNHNTSIKVNHLPIVLQLANQESLCLIQLSGNLTLARDITRQLPAITYKEIILRWPHDQAAVKASSRLMNEQLL